MIGFIRRWVSLSRQVGKTAATAASVLAARQMEFEAEGAAAGRAGGARSDCPYLQNSFEWNHWVYGYDRATAPRMVGLDGSAIYTSTATDQPSHKSSEYLLRYPDGRITTPDGRPAVISDGIGPPHAQFKLKACYDKSRKFLGYST